VLARGRRDLGQQARLGLVIGTTPSQSARNTWPPECCLWAVLQSNSAQFGPALQAPARRPRPGGPCLVAPSLSSYVFITSLVISGIGLRCFRPRTWPTYQPTLRPRGPISPGWRFSQLASVENGGACPFFPPGSVMPAAGRTRPVDATPGNRPPVLSVLLTACQRAGRVRPAAAASSGRPYQRWTAVRGRLRTSR